MSIIHNKHVPLATLSTFRMGGIAKEVVTLENENDVMDFFKDLSTDTRWLVLGGGSNVVFSDGDCNTLIVKYSSNTIHIATNKHDSDEVEVVVDAGVVWDAFVEYAVVNNLSGVEALSAIPGLVGATPIQNVGAYGAEISNVLVSLRAYDCIEKKFVTISNEECKFGYRDSIFKHEAKGRYLITQITFLLSKESPDVPRYQGVAEYFAAHEISRPTLQDIRNAIIAIRAKKLPNPKEVASVGSFFKNPIVSKEKGEQLKKDFPTLAVFPLDEQYTKIGAGSLIDTLGWKGKRIGNFSFYTGNAMVVVHEGGGDYAELVSLIQNLNQELQKKYGIELEPEPEILKL